MKRVLFLLCLLPLSVYSQGRLKGGKFFQAGVGFRGSGPLISSYGGMSFGQNVKGIVGGGFGFGNQPAIKYNYIFLDGIGSFTVRSVNRVFYLDVQGGITFNGDFISDFKTEGYNKQFSMNYGVIGGLEAEFYASKSLILVLTANERYYIKEDFGRWRFQIGAALRFMF